MDAEMDARRQPGTGADAVRGLNFCTRCESWYARPRSCNCWDDAAGGAVGARVAPPPVDAPAGETAHEAAHEAAHETPVRLWLRRDRATGAIYPIYPPPPPAAEPVTRIHWAVPTSTTAAMVPGAAVQWITV